MGRRVVSLVLLPCLLLTQSAGFGHSHGGGQPPGHDSRPHMHVRVIPAARHHGHRHSPHDHDGDHYHDRDDEPEAAPPPAAPFDHDDDAVYAPAHAAVAARGPVTFDANDHSVSVLPWTAVMTDHRD